LFGSPSIVLRFPRSLVPSQTYHSSLHNLDSSYHGSCEGWTVDNPIDCCDDGILVFILYCVICVTELVGIQSRFKPARVFKGAIEDPPGGPGKALPRHITGLAFDNKGEVCLTAAEDESYRLYSCKSGKCVECWSAIKVAHRFML
jgi:hypothetical protein